VLGILLTRPHYLDWSFDLLRNLDRANNVVGLQPSAKPAANEMIVDDNLL
jgi:hypothetical protein